MRTARLKETRRARKLQEIRQLADPSDKWRVQFDAEWLIHNGTTVALRQHGYALGSATQENGQTGEERIAYWISNIDDPTRDEPTIIFETTDQDELNRYINLILPPRS